MLPDVARLERAALNAVPTPRVVFDGGLVLRAFRGGTGRGNAASSLDPRADGDLPARIGRMTDFYRRLGLPPRYRSTPLDPEGMQAALAAQGYTPRDATTVLAATALAPLEGVVEALDEPSAEWLSVIATAEYQVPARQAEKLEQVALLGLPRAWLVLRENGVALAAGFVVADGELAGFFDIAVRPEGRRRGLGQRLMRGGAAWAAGLGAVRPWLQVSAENAPARALYAGLGFVEVYQYRYWMI